MRRCRILVFAAALASAVLEAPGAGRGGAFSKIATERMAFEVCGRGSEAPTGRMSLRVTRAAGSVVLNAEFEAPYKETRAGYTSTALYKTGRLLRLVRASASTRLGRTKVMEGRLEFPEGGDANVTATGYTDRKKRLLDTPRQLEKEMAAPEGAILTFPAFLYFAPRLLETAGQRDGAVYASLPDDLFFPEFVELVADCRLVRTAADTTGGFRIEFRQRFPGGNFKVKARATFDAAGNVTEATFGRFTLRPAAEDVPDEPGEGGGRLRS